MGEVQRMMAQEGTSGGAEMAEANAAEEGYVEDDGSDWLSWPMHVFLMLVVCGVVWLVVD